MRIQLLFIPLFFTFLSSAQTKDNVTLAELYGNISRSFGYCGDTYVLDSNFSYKKHFHCCMSDSTNEEGTWTFQNDNVLTFKYSNSSRKYVVISLNDCLYLIPEGQLNCFDNFMQCLDKKYRRLLKRRGQGAADSYIFYSLTNKYYYKQL